MSCCPPRAEPFVKRRRWQVGIVGIKIIEECEEGTLLIAIQPVESVLIDGIRRLSIQVLVVLNPFAKSEIVENQPRKAGTRGQLSPRQRIVFVMREPARQARSGTAITQICHESRGSISLAAKELCQCRVGGIERPVVVCRYFMIPAAREHAGVGG